MFTILPQFCSWFGCCNINPEWLLNQTKRYSPMAKLDLDSALENIACRKHNVSSLTAAAFKKCNNDVRALLYIIFYVSTVMGSGVACSLIALQS